VHNLQPADLAKLLADGDRLTRARRDTVPAEPPRHWQPGVGATGFGAALLADATEQGLPLPWAPRAGRVSACAGRVGDGLRLHGGEQPAAVMQGLFLPTHRVQRYTGRIWARREGDAAGGQLQVGFARRDPAGEAVASSHVAPPGHDWMRLDFTLELPQDEPQGGVADFEPVDFTLTWRGAADLILDRIELYPADQVHGLDPSVIAACRAWDVPLLRWPGGNFVSGYHWRDGIGPAELRPTRPNQAWGGIETNAVGTDEFLKFCRLIGAEPHICVNIGTGTPEEAAAWVEYCNGPADSPMGRLRAQCGHPEPYGITWWEVGNEIYARWQIGHCDSAENARRFRAFARAMRAVDPSIRLIANGNPFDFVEPGPQWSFTCADGHWHQALLACDELDFISLHALPENARRMEDAADLHAHAALMAHPLAWERDDLPELLAQAAAAGQPQVRLAITEWGVLGWSDTRPRVDNYGEVPYAGLFLNLLIRNAPQIPVANATALLHGGCIRKAAERLFYDAQYFALQLYTQPDQVRAVAVQLTGPGYDVTGGTETTPAVADVPYLDAAACLTDGDRTLHVFIVNRHLSEALPVELHLDGFRAANAVQALMTTPAPGTAAPATNAAAFDYAAVASPWAPNAFAPIHKALPIEGDVVALSLPPFSLSRLTFYRREG
ncbi:MAG TPA: hypothetical protein VFK80_05335, partial [Limnochordia bacterium]|nr:hypothetical protein [Limnochordia bacterium]